MHERNKLCTIGQGYEELGDMRIKPEQKIGIGNKTLFIYSNEKLRVEDLEELKGNDRIDCTVKSGKTYVIVEPKQKEMMKYGN